MLLLSAIISFFLCLAEGGELLIAKTPLSIKFQGDDAIDQHLVPEICAAAMGFTTQQESDWHGMKIADPFNFAEAVAVLYVDGIQSLGKSSNLKKYILNNNEDELTTWRKIKNKIMDRFPMENNTLVRLDMGYSGEMDEIETKHLNKNLEEDAEFLKELTDLYRYMKKIKKSDGVPDLYWFSISGLHQLSDLKGLYDSSTVEAKEKVFDSLLKLGKAFNSAYNGKALVIAVVSDASHTRRVRSVEEGKTEALNATESNKDYIYDPDFPIIFNIILWFSVALIFSLLAVSIFIASMDPGRDSIIYRMTSNRMKKDS